MIWRRIRNLALIVAFGVYVTPVYAEEPVILSTADSENQLSQLELAISSGRLVQADSMLRWLQSRTLPEYSSRLNLLAAEYFMAVGDVAAASSMLETIETYKADPCRYGGVSGWLAYRNGDWNKAIAMLASSLNSCPDDPGRWNLLGLAMMQKSEYSASIEAFDAALAILPGHPSLLNNRALANAYAGRTLSAIEDLDKAAAITGSNGTIAENLAVLRANMGLPPPLTGHEDNIVRASLLAKAGDGASAAEEHKTARAYYAEALLLLDHFDRRLWAKAGAAQPLTEQQEP